MASLDSPDLSPPIDSSPEREQHRSAPLRTKEKTLAAQTLAALASLRLTVVLLGLMTFLVLAGTLAQVDHDVWFVVDQGYFRVWFAFIELQTLPNLIGVFKPNNLQFPGGFYFPGGWLIGSAMALNLLVAHWLRFKVVARGQKLSTGLAMLAVGLGATAWVVVKGLDTTEQAAISPLFADRLWHLIRAGIAALALGGAYWLSLLQPRLRKPEWWALAAFDGAVLAVAIALFLNPQWQINDAGMRIIWQLLQSSIAGGLLLASCWLLFGKRAGVVLLHAGIAVLMVHELYTGTTAKESFMTIAEGESVNYSVDHRRYELALVDATAPDRDAVTVIPAELLQRAAAAPAGSPERLLQHPDLPVDVAVLDYFPSSKLQPLQTSEADEAMQAAGRMVVAKPAQPVSGLNSEQRDLPSTYLELRDKTTGESHGKYLASGWFDPHVLRDAAQIAQHAEQPVALGDRQLWLSLRLRRIYKPYAVTLHDFQFGKYMGTNRAKDYSSYVQLTDPEHGADLHYRIYMNNPLRYRGETLYQASFDPTETSTVLQVVKNESWMLPYVACALVGLGMLVHFGHTLARFLNRRAAERDRLANTPAATATPPGPQSKPSSKPDGLATSRPGSSWQTIVPVGMALLVAGYLLSKMRPSEVVVDQMPVHEFAALPVADQGRIKPLDTLARRLLQELCARQEAVVSLDGKEKIPASQWLLEMIAGRPEALHYYVFRITNLELLDTLQLPRRPQFFKYSFAELEKQAETLFQQLQLTAEIDDAQLTPYQRQVRQLWSQRSTIVNLMNSMGQPTFGKVETFAEDFRQAFRTQARHRDVETPRSILPFDPSQEWLTLYEASLRSQCGQLRERLQGDLSSLPPGFADAIDDLTTPPPNPAFVHFGNLLAAYREGNPAAFTESIAAYRTAMSRYETQLIDPHFADLAAGLKPAERLQQSKVRFETWFSTASPFYYCSVLYLLAMVLTSLAWLGQPVTLGRSATAIVLVTAVVHVLAIVGRMYISGRPPITNLYDTLVFNGCAVVIAMLILESIFRLGIGNFVASAVGFATLFIAHAQADNSGDTFTVLQAVLDTQFWLTTHVITINLGYATTVLAGCLGIAYVVLIHLLGFSPEKWEQPLMRMMYGSLCFALLFSFIGTVLGGLWADDSWGRFWGWDPKENGAMMIVLWNALALHARWGKMVAARGLAALLMVGNIITAWSWFGVNQLGQGLHNYGFSDELGFALGLFVMSQLTMLAIALLPSPQGFDRTRGSG